MIRTCLVLLTSALAGCAQVTAYTLAHKEAVAAVSLLSGMSQSVVGLFNQVDEAEHRIEKRVQE